jgi:hypothetical protein
VSGGCGDLATLLCLVAALCISCGGGKKEFTITVGDDEGTRVQGLVISDVGSGARIGITDANGQASLMLARPKDARLFLRLRSPEQDGRPLYVLEDEEIEITDQDLKRGRRVIRVERSAPPESIPSGMATFQIASDPSGATVLIDGEDKGFTPVFLSDLPPGRIHVELRLDGYQPWRQDVLLTADGTADTIVLQKAAAAAASLWVDSSPKGATIVLDQHVTGEKTPATLTDLKPGRHKVRLELSDHEANETSVTLRAGEQATVKLQLQSTRSSTGNGPQERKNPPKIRYSVSAKPWALVFVDGDPVPRGESGPFTISLTPGTHRFRCVNEATGTDVTLSRELPAGDTATILILDWQNRRITARTN